MHTLHFCDMQEKCWIVFSTYGITTLVDYQCLICWPADFCEGFQRSSLGNCRCVCRGLHNDRTPAEGGRGRGLEGAGGERGRIGSIWSHLSLRLGGLLLITMELTAMNKGKIRVISHNAFENPMSARAQYHQNQNQRSFHHLDHPRSRSHNRMTLWRPTVDVFLTRSQSQNYLFTPHNPKWWWFCKQDAHLNLITQKIYIRLPSFC